MTIKEAAIIEVYTGICFLTGDKRKYAYEYASSLIGRPVYTHEFLTLEEELKKRSYKDFIEICKNLEETHMERLTVPDEKIEGGVRRTVIDSKEVKKNAMTIYWALKKYEDTGLDPEQIRELKERDTAKKPEPAPLGMEGMVCPTCGCKAVPWVKFCDECGQKFVED